ncbi:unnamed protein product [Caenorhabditis auriculariae]|uniref:Serpentine receptor class gamma n=1 Tax=Caenorhabditis auriculariae TaxID=2777116 RepID=A0A8S1HPA3_9PELO|nr:unnamed protein product [Caenorhabditis auriculariae]
MIIHVTPLCWPLIAVFGYFEPSFILTPFYFLTHYSQALKYILQCFGFICISPLAVVWNVAISETFLVEELGGLTVGYTRVVSWAGLSSFMLLLSALTLLILGITTTVTLIGLVSMTTRLKTSERNLFIVTLFMVFTIVINSMARAGFLVPSIMQMINVDYLLIIQYLTIDFCNVCTPIVMIYMSSPLRKVLLEKEPSIIVVASSTESVASNRSK